MKTLSIRNPLAYFVTYGIKDIENRTWKTDYRGPVLIHCSGTTLAWPSAKALPEQLQRFILDNDLSDNLEEWPDWLLRYNFLCEDAANYLGISPSQVHEKDADRIISKAANQKGFPLRSQSLLGVVDLVDIVEDSDSPWALPNQYHWVLENARPFSLPVTGVKGKLRLWNYHGEVPETVSLD